RLRTKGRHNEDPRTDRDGVEPGQVYRLPYLLHYLQERLDQSGRRGVRLVQQRGVKARYWLSQGLGKSDALEGGMDPQEEWQDRPQSRLQMAAAGQDLRQPGSSGNR